MSDFVDNDVAPLLHEHQLDSFDALWALSLEPVDEPNTERGGWSSVCRVELKPSVLGGESRSFYLKRQCNHRSLSWRRPFGEPTFAREWRNIDLYRRHGVPALSAVYFAERPSAEGQQAILMTVALDDYQPLSAHLDQWQTITADDRQRMLSHIGAAIAQLHQARLTHHCLYPKHIYVSLDQRESVRFIDLEKTRPQLLKWRERVADLDALLRRCKAWSEQEVEIFLKSYLARLASDKPLSELKQKLSARRANKASR